MSDGEVWIVIAVLIVATILTRSVPFLFADSLKLPPRLQHALRYAPAAAMAAIVLPDLVFTQAGTPDIGLHNPKLLAGIAALVFCCVTRHMLGTIAVGMVVFTILRLLLT